MIVALAPYATEWLDLLARWLHVIAAIVWIGTSFYFVALDNHLRPPRERQAAGEGVGGEAWEIHGGGFYRVEKYRVTPPAIPSPLYWFKWEAYTTWLSGFALFVVLYYLHRMSLQETASTLGIQLGTVKSRLYYALRALRVELEGDDRLAGSYLPLPSEERRVRSA